MDQIRWSPPSPGFLKGEERREILRPEMLDRGADTLSSLEGMLSNLLSCLCGGLQVFGFLNCDPRLLGWALVKQLSLSHFCPCK